MTALNTAALTVTLTGEDWTPDGTAKTITADFGGVAGTTGDDGLAASTGSAALTVSPARLAAPAGLSWDSGGAAAWEAVDSAASQSTPLHTVSFDLMGGTGTAPMQLVPHGSYAAAPTEPVRAHYTFGGWYGDSGFDESSEWDFTTSTVTGPATLYARWLSTDAGVTAVSVSGTDGMINGTQITVTLPFGSTLPSDTSAITIIPAEGAAYDNLTMTTGEGTVTYSFTVTAEDGTTTADYTVTVSIGPDPSARNRADVNAAKTVVENHTWTVAQATANTEEAVKEWIEEQLSSMNLSGVSYTVTMYSFTAATAGSAADRDGTNGSFAFTVTLSKGMGTAAASGTVTIAGGAITATSYNSWTVTVTARNGGTVSGGGTFEDSTLVTVTATPINSNYRFVRWTETARRSVPTRTINLPFPQTAT